MSQAGIISTSSGPVPPTVATTYVTDVNSPAIPALNILNVLGGSSTEFDIDSIRTDGSSGSNTLTIQLTNLLSGTTTTVGAATGDAITFAIGATPRTVVFDIRIAAFNSSTPAGAGYNLFGTVRTDGVTATLSGTPDKIVNEEAALFAADANLIVSGNNTIIQVTGVAGLTINWVAQGIYTRAL